MMVLILCCFCILLLVSELPLSLWFNFFNSTSYVAAKEAVGANETPYGGWSVTRLRSAAKGTANVESLSLGIGPKGGLGEQGDSVSRQLILTKLAIVERRPDNYEVLWMLFYTNPDLVFWRHCIT